MNIENNKLIAEFMGWKRESNVYHTPMKEYHECDEQYFEEVNILTVNEMKFHSSWDWLMPVVERIRSINEVDKFIVNDFNYNISNDVTIEIDMDGVEKTLNYSILPKETEIEMVYRAIVSLIKWHKGEKK